MNHELYQMRRELMKLKADCEDLLKSSQKETELLNQIHPSVTFPLNAPPSSVETTPATEPRQKQWRFMNEAGQIPESIVRRAVCDPNLLEAIAAEIEERSGQKQ